MAPLEQSVNLNGSEGTIVIHLSKLYAEAMTDER